MDLTACKDTHGIFNVTVQRVEIAALSWDHEEMNNIKETHWMNVARSQIDGKNVEESGGVESPFKKSTVITRSPPLNVTNIEASSKRVNNVDKLGKKYCSWLNSLNHVIISTRRFT